MSAEGEPVCRSLISGLEGPPSSFLSELIASMTDTTAQTPGLSGNVLFYSQPEPLSVEAHGTLGVDPVEKPYAFTATTNLVPLTVTEFAPAALSYPVIFVGDAKQPVAVMGLRPGENLFVSADGDFRSEAYIPAYVRRYPFVFANDDAQKRLILCVDRGALPQGRRDPAVRRRPARRTPSRRWSSATISSRSVSAPRPSSPC
jgi:hypothetical protein